MKDIDNYEYYYPGTSVSIKDVQQVELEILDELDRICKILKIPYQLAYGTLLGAVRHKGFIPWDDDLDVFMKRSDYERFLKDATSVLNNKYFLQTYYSDADYVLRFAKIRKKGTNYYNESDPFETFNNGIWIDIFPLDNVKPGTIAGWYQRLQVFVYNYIIISSRKATANYCTRLYKKIVRKIVYYLLKIIPKQYFIQRMQKILTRYDSVNTGYMAVLAEGLTQGLKYAFIMPEAGYYNMIELEFCKKKYPCPRNYKDVLSECFGNYMELPPEDKRYPCHGATKITV